LNREVAVLQLPSAKRAAVIFDGEFVARHCYRTNRMGGRSGVPRK
jgi:hypothetical protein